MNPKQFFPLPFRFASRFNAGRGEKPIQQQNFSNIQRRLRQTRRCYTKKIIGRTTNSVAFDEMRHRYIASEVRVQNVFCL